MRYLVKKSFIEVLGIIWLPPIECAQTITLSQYDVDNIREGDGSITRESVEQWLCTHAGDFQSIKDFCASIEDGDKTVDIEWASEQGEMAFADCMT